MQNGSLLHLEMEDGPCFPAGACHRRRDDCWHDRQRHKQPPTVRERDREKVRVHIHPTAGGAVDRISGGPSPFDTLDSSADSHIAREQAAAERRTREAGRDVNAHADRLTNTRNIADALHTARAG